MPRDAWLVDDALSQLVAAADRHPRAAAVGPRLLNPDGTLQRSVRGFPTTWRLATEYLYLRKLAPRSRALNAFYGGGLLAPMIVAWSIVLLLATLYAASLWHQFQARAQPFLMH